MMKRGVAMMTVLAMMGVGLPGAFAQSDTEEGVRSQLVIFDGMTIDGKFQKPDIHKASANQRAKFNRLSRLKKSMIKQVVETGEDQALK